MDTDIARLPAFEASPTSWAHVVGTCIEIFGVVIIVVGYPLVNPSPSELAHERSPF
jgi:hypothetical protein